MISIFFTVIDAILSENGTPMPEFLGNLVSILCLGPLTISMMTRKQFSDFSFALVLPDGTPLNRDLSYLDRLSAFWLLLWRGGLLGVGIGFFIGGLLIWLLGRPLAYSLLLAAMVFYVFPRTIEMMLEKQFTTFRFQVVPREEKTSPTLATSQSPSQG